MIVLQRMLFLRKVALFSSFSPQELENIASIAEEVVVPAGTTIIREGDYGDSLFILVDGEVRVHLGERELGILRAGECFGEMAILDGEPRSASATAMSDCLILRLAQAGFYDILSSNFEAVLVVMRTLCARLRAAAARNTALETRLVEERSAPPAGAAPSPAPGPGGRRDGRRG